MADKCFDYFTAAEAEQFSFYRMPKALFTEKDFKELSCEAKVLYGMMLDRMGLSIRNQWFDSLGRAYIIFTVEDVMGVMGCGSQKAVRLMKELDTADGIGLIEKKRIGLGRPNRIYVKNFMVRGDGGSDIPEDVCDRSGTKGTSLSYDMDDMQKKETVHADMSECEERSVFADTGCMGNMEGIENAHNCQNGSGQMYGKIMLKYADSSEKTADTQDANRKDMDTDAAWDNKMQCSSGNVSDSMKSETVNLQKEFFQNSLIVSGMEDVHRYSQTGSAVAENQNSDSVTCFSKEEAVKEKEYGITDNCFSAECTAEVPEMASACPAGTKAGDDRENETVFADKAVEAMVKELLYREEKTAVCISPEQDLQAAARQDFPEPEELHFEKRNSAIVDDRIPESRNAECNDTEYSNTEYSETEYSQTEKKETDVSVTYQSYQSYASNQNARQNGRDSDMDGNGKADSMEEKMDAYRKKIRENISYASFQFPETENVDELVELMVDVMMVPDRHTIRIAGTEKPASVVKGRFMKLMYSHIEYVLECLHKCTGNIRNIKAYLLTTLYNSLLTINSYYRAEVNHDLYGYRG